MAHAFWKASHKDKKGRRPRRAVVIVLVVVLLCVVVAAGYAAYYDYAYRWRKTHEPSTQATQTDTSPIYSDDEFRATLERYGFDKLFDLDEVVASSYVIPGLRAARTLEGDSRVSTCASMVPQGVCEAEGYVLVSAYCASKTHNSLIYVLDRDTHALVKEVALRGTPHVGGIAYDPESRNVWVCGYDDGTEVAYANVVSLEAIEGYSLDGKVPCEYSAQYPVYTMERTSFLDYYDRQVYIGNFVGDRDDASTVQAFPLKYDGTPYTLGDLRGFLRTGLTEEGRRRLGGYLRYNLGFSLADEYGIDDDEMLVPGSISFISSKIQGFTVDGDLTAASQSSGPSDSKVYLFENDGDVFDALRTADNAIASYTLPPMLEQITLTDGRLYLCFESAAYAYRARLNDKVDRIVVLDVG